jgi:hypothetical protein
MRYPLIALAILVLAQPARAGTVVLLQICHDNVCEKHNITPAEGITVFACAIQSQKLAAQWLMENRPTWVPRKIICTDATRTADL